MAEGSGEMGPFMLSLSPPFLSEMSWQGNQNSKLQSIPIKDLQGFCFQGSQVAFSSYFNWQVENGRDENANLVNLFLEVTVQRSAKRRGCLLSYSQAEPGRELTQPSPWLLAEPCTVIV